MPGGLVCVAVVSLVVGVGMAGFWSLALLTRQVPEVREGRVDVWFHITAEFLTALALLAGAAGILIDYEAGWSIAVSSIGLGLLIYTLIASPGYYVERRDRAGVWMFVGFWLLAVPAVVLRLVYL